MDQHLTRGRIRQLVACPECQAERGQRCFVPGWPTLLLSAKHNHVERRQAALAHVKALRLGVPK